MASDAFAKCGFERVAENSGHEIWTYDLLDKGIITNQFVKTVEFWENADGEV